MARRPLLTACALALAVPLALGSLAACAASDASSTGADAGSTAAAGATPSSAAVSDSAGLITDLGQAGHACTAATGSAGAIAMPGLRSSLNCVISGARKNSGSANATVAVFDDHAHAAAFADLLTSSKVSGMLLGGTAERAVLGSNWVVLVPDDAAYADAVHAALGGTVLDGGTSTAGASASHGG